ncbi:alkyl hydroperoxide reductase subunit F [Simiduia curdlanivorans]|uniref:Alkyl hydroperoxide reductase subunit F n=1 Tax=Simiduia curdlanivorans TaxID=1492769 RepID=A0ABV8V4Z6_9GAMM|nr:alkyl hydroperoxide reductase subunit F [Simiduia curdlanivorans]MDN3638347.1 alkyl hydroperoxide reductase subunit F [Simiduia curdlanivorans]
MISQEILAAVKQYTTSLTKDVKLIVQVGNHSKRDELMAFLREFTSASEKLSLEERDVPAILRSPISFQLEVDGDASGIIFSGIPSGHEFNSFVLAVLQAGGTALKLDESVKTIVRAVAEPLHFEVFVSLSCHNCPDVVQLLNQFALLNPHISSEMIDGGLFPQLIAERDIQGVPSVYLNGELFANGKVDTPQLLEKLLQRSPDLANANQGVKLPRQDVTIIGGGPSGVAAAIYAARKGLAVTLIADRIGGQVKDTVGIENLISVPKTTGSELTSALMAHMNDYAITLKEHVSVTEVMDDNAIKSIKLSTGELIESKTLIIATGARWRELGVPGEKENVGSGVAYCPHCDGPFFKGKDVAVIGGGNSGVEAALDLAGIVRSVKLFEFLPELKADKVLVDKAKVASNIEIYINAKTTSVEAETGKVSALHWQDRESGESHRQPLDGIFVQIGLVPNSQFLGDLVETTRHGEIVVNEKCQTSVPGIFACGDVTTVPYKQIVIAMGEGSKAALSAFEYLLTR